MTLLEVMLALVILGLVGLGYLELLHQSHRLISDSRRWSQAVGYAEDAMERVKLHGAPIQPVVDNLPGGFRRKVAATSWRSGLTAVEVTLTLPGGGRFDLDRLIPIQPPIARGNPSPDEDPW
jgi:prepilin-type N-terminal cleavage/methylation domain-containing protein